MKVCKFKGVGSVIEGIRKSGGKVVFLSEYPCKQKLNALELPYDMAVDCTMAEINTLKPSARTVNFILNAFNTKARDTIYVGDRFSKDGASARSANVLYLEKCSVFSTRDYQFKSYNALRERCETFRM